MRKRMLPVVALLALSLGWTQTAHARGGLIFDLFELGRNVLDGTIPRVYTAAFGVLVLLILILGIAEARKNARAAHNAPSPNASPEAGAVDLSKRS